jgi:multiple antibiotic resistance protein|tara:strand:- start:898 stop:1527 length:630 start_codon:yes stop_codon:yes gene_type:complete
MFDQLLENTILLFVAVDPIALVPIFATLTKGLQKSEIKKIYLQATIVSLLILTSFWLFGEGMLSLMGISMSSFRIIGGLFLIAIAFQMVFEQRQDRRQNTADVAMDDKSIQSVAIFPLAIPLIAGPGAMTAALLLAESRSTEPALFILNYLPILLVVMLAGIAMWLSAKLSQKLGPTVITVLEKIFGILLGALAIEFVMAGIIESFKLT